MNATKDATKLAGNAGEKSGARGRLKKLRERRRLAKQTASETKSTFAQTGNLYAGVLTAILLVSVGGTLLAIVGGMAGEAAAEAPDEAAAAQIMAHVDEDTAPAADTAGCTVVTEGAVDAAASVDADAVGSRTYYDVNLTNAQQDAVYRYCEEFDVPPTLAFGVISADMLTSRAGDGAHAHAVMNLNPDTSAWYAEHLGLTQPLSPEDGLRCGIFMLSEYYHKYGEIEKIAMCYELGESAAVDQWTRGVVSTEYSALVASRTVTLRERVR